MRSRRESLTLVAFVGAASLSGGNAVAVRFSNRELAPLWGAGLRFALAAAGLVAIMLLLGLPLPRGRSLVGAFLFGLFNFGGAFALAYYGLVEVHAGLGQILLAVVPLATMLLAVVQRQEKLHVAAVAGILLALVGIVLVSRAPLREAVPWLSLVALLGSALCFGQAAVLVRRFPPIHPVVLNAVGMTTGAAVLVVASALLDGRISELAGFRLPERTETWISLLYVVVVGSIVVFLLYVFVIERWSASRGSYVFVLIPVFTVLLSVWLDDERVGLEMVLGGLLAMAGVYVGALRPRSRTAVQTEAIG